MKVIIFLICFFILISCNQKNRKGPIILYRSQIINLGTIEFKKVYSGQIVVKNNGDEVLEILNTTSDCACTVTNIDNKKISPRDSTYIHFNIKPAIDGYLQQNIYIDNNSVNESRVLFLLRAKVVLNN